jgi:hypothetical protein
VASLDEDLALLRSERAITRVLHRYAQGVDRCRLAQIRSCYWDDAVDDHAPHFSGPVDDYVRWLGEALPPLESISHQLTNILIDVDLTTGTADVESYCLNSVIPKATGTTVPARTFQCLRYLDGFERRGEEWRILRRRVARDWSWAPT